MKRINIEFLLILCLVFGLTACNAVTPGPSTTRSSAAAITATTAEEAQDEEDDAQSSGEGITEEESSAEESETETEAAEEDLVYATSGVNVRDAASSNSNIVGTLSEGEAVVKIGEEGSWTKVEYNGAECYVYSEYLTETAP
ncbi:MAG: SH3 domain-containing protein [Lachnospiraceae bacterium]|nr:SH3 domain-containing protein [Lachnospiraceae bacterium]